MISVEYTRVGNQHSMAVAGHAGAAEYGKDIVCAGVSAVINSLALYLEYQKIGADIRLKPGSAHISCRGGPAVCAAFETAACGLAIIAKQYPQYVEIILPARG